MKIEVIKIDRTNRGKGIEVLYRLDGVEQERYIVRKTGGEKYQKISVWSIIHNGQEMAYFLPHRAHVKMKKDRTYKKFQYCVNIDKAATDSDIDLSPGRHLSNILADALLNN